MSNIDLGDTTVQKLCDSFAGLQSAPRFSISDDTDVHITILKRKDKYSGVRTGMRTEFKSREEFLVYSVLVEDIPAKIKNTLTLTQLKIEKCSEAEISDIFNATSRIGENSPRPCDVKRSYIIGNDSDLNWAFLEEETKYHSVFWMESESSLFGRCA